MSVAFPDDFAPRPTTESSERTLLFEIASALRDIVEELKRANAQQASASEINQMQLKMLKAQLEGGIVQGLIVPVGTKGH